MALSAGTINEKLILRISVQFKAPNPRKERIIIEKDKRERMVYSKSLET